MADPLKLMFESIIRVVQQHYPEPLTLRSYRPVHGGCISSSYLLDCGTRQLFIKSHDAEYLPMFEAEMHGLRSLQATATVTVPSAIACGIYQSQAWLALGYITLHPLTGEHGAALGQQLAALHQHTAETFGYPINNFIGLSPQDNTRHSNWCDFFHHCRLQPQFNRLQQQGRISSTMARKAAHLLEALPDWLGDHHPEPSLLHGDLWSGNAACDAAGKPVLFDPACYYGDRETDLAMMQLFGGFPPSFFHTYQQASPLAAGASSRIALYNLYHLLNHANLFGGSYISQSERVIDELLC